MSEIKFEARRSSFQVHQPPSIINQRRTSFTNNMSIPDLLVFTPAPGVGKYNSNENILYIDSTKYSIPKAERACILTNTERKTPGHAYFPSNEKIPGSYLSSDHSDQFKIKKQRRTSFSSNLKIPDLNVRVDDSDSPGVGKYIINKNTIGTHETDPILVTDPAYSMPKAARDVVQNKMAQSTPGHAWLPGKEKIPGHYSAFRVGRRTSAGINLIPKTPGPSDYMPEKSIDSMSKATPVARIPTARRFSNNFF